ncbi:hypothetical protein I5U59_04225 [Stenotrophomonas maltophilia]|uniref:hypothetical protein n=1 Tax=Bacteria TaxID=2 RepID=UPI0006AA3C88|nr:hypothetical protein [Stenotrophomonas maltophilia]ALA82127.1 hypothetical protein VN11_08590 [Stenotrophomonas maltophilia]MBH1477110.1 hypothetical protein [Stenotrophomonas maltophilia]MBH1502279.1 hypothetical protein [Stenotrophomonas maltophilia]MBH1784463.1 hypothetical protein [Stenotrophomonas maltophilia]
MSIFDGLSECWLLGETCVVNWEAWSAIGTVTAVFAAVLAPAIQRRFVRRRINALFAASVDEEIAAAERNIRRMAADYPIGQGGESGVEAEASLMEEAYHRRQYANLGRTLESFISTDIDLTRWAAVDLTLTSDFARAIHFTKAVVQGAQSVEHPGDGSSWQEYFSEQNFALHEALTAVMRARKSCRKALISSAWYVS